MKKKMSVVLLCVLMMSTMVSSAFAVYNCVPNFPYISSRQFKPDVQIKEADNGKGEATVLIPFKNEDRSWWEFWKPAYVYKEAKMKTKDLPKQDKPWWQIW